MKEGCMYAGRSVSETCVRPGFVVLALWLRGGIVVALLRVFGDTDRVIGYVFNCGCL